VERRPIIPHVAHLFILIYQAFGRTFTTMKNIINILHMFQLLFNDIIHYLLSIIFVAIHISKAPIKIKKLQHLHKYMKKWRNNLAHINQAIDTYFKTYYKVVDYHIKKPNLRVTDITWRPYGYRKWLR